MKKTTILKLIATSGFAISIFTGCKPIGAPDTPKIYTGQAKEYKDYYFITKDPASGEKITADKIKKNLSGRMHCNKWGGILALQRVYVNDKLFRHGFEKNVKFTDKYIIGKVKVYNIVRHPDEYDKCEVTFKKPYTLTKKDNKWDLRVAYEAVYVNISKGCLPKCALTGGYCMAINNWSPDEIRNRINVLPTSIVLEGKHINQNGVFNTKNTKEIILANLNRKFKKARYFPIGLLDNKDYEFLRKNNLETDNFKYVYYVENKYGAKIFIALHIDPTRKGSKVYYLATDTYTIESDGIPHTTKKEFDKIIQKVKTIANQ